MLNKKYFENKRVSVIGFGKSGISASKFLYEQGAKLFISDAKKTDQEIINLLNELNINSEYETGGHSEKILNADLIILSPGIAGIDPILNKARAKGLNIRGEFELGFKVVNPKKIIAITGTNGKTTTTALTAEICNKFGEHTICAGNIGLPLTSVVKDVRKDTVLVLEVSSYQLETIGDFKADSAAVLNVTPDHLDRYKTINDYCDTKCLIFNNQDETSIGVYNSDSSFSERIRKNIKGISLSFSMIKEKGDIYFNNGSIVYPDLDWRYDVRNLKIPGEHNIQNVMAAILLTRDIVKSNPKLLTTIVSDFSGVAHRLEKIRVYNNITFINDSKSTNVDSTQVAIQSFKQPIILLMGGRDKGAPYAPLIADIKKHVRCIVAFGEGRARIERELRDTIPVKGCDDLKCALDIALEESNPNDIILLSPACASFDQFQNFEHRGQYFKELVNKL
ncbi:MAG: UDP-N-acetylmuramoyl-L-alanine--D-glutamate ligase [Elusimicrobiota bacterium]